MFNKTFLRAIAVFICAAFLTVLPAFAVTLEQVISREHPSFSVTGSHMVVGRDGKVYLFTSDYIMRMTREGKEKLGGKVTYAMWGADANADGIMASANAHFSHSVNLWSPSFGLMGTVNDFLSSDATEWFGPCDVQAGEKDFYGMDQNRERIIRITPPGKMVTTYSLKGTGETYIRTMNKFRVWEAGKRFYISNRFGTITVIDFDSNKLWSMSAGTGGDPWGGYAGAFDVDKDGKLYVIAYNSDTVKIYDTDGKPAGEIKLQIGDRKGRITDLQVYGDEVIIKRNHPVELFQIYSNTGEFKRAVSADVEKLTVGYPSDVWTAGQNIPVTINLDTYGKKNTTKMRVWWRQFNTPKFSELVIKDGAVAIPVDAGGLYQLKVSSGLAGVDSEYLVQTIVEVRQSDAKGSVSIFSPANRLYYGHGEEIPLSVILRVPKAENLLTEVTLQLTDGTHAIIEKTLPVMKDQPSQFTISKNTITVLAPGNYWVTAKLPGFTIANQPLIIGPGITTAPVFNILQYGDYGASFPGGGIYDAPTNIAANLDNLKKLNYNMYVDRMGHGGSGVLGQFDRNVNTDEQMAKIKADPLSIAPEKAQMENPIKQAIASYGAYGAEERAILLYMDAGLPVGTSFDARKPEEYEKAITNVCNNMAAYPAFRGWSWAANWWINPSGAAAAKTPEDKAAYTAALKAANDTGTWDPILDKVSDIWVNYAIDAEKQFDATLQKVAPGKISGITGPYRQPGIIPPLTFANADEVDLQYQAEQVQPPQVTPHNVDFYKRPGKRAWGHPEVWNDDGTGGMIFPSIFQMVMRGADGVGQSGDIHSMGGSGASDVRATGPGVVSIHRTLNNLLKSYGPWLTTTKNNDKVAILVSTRMLRIDNWKSIGGLYFDRLFEAYNACLYAHRPASFVFAEDITPDTMKQYTAILLAGQRVQWDPKIQAALDEAKLKGIPVFYDGNCRAELVAGFTPLGFNFDKVENDQSAWQDDSSYYRFANYFKDEAAKLNEKMAAVKPVAVVDNPEIMLTERISGNGRFLWVVNNTMLNLDPAVAWRVSLIMSQRMPVIAPVTINAGGNVVYDVFARQQVSPAGAKTDPIVQADLRSMPARLYAILPAPISQVAIGSVKSVSAGQILKWTAFVQDIKGKPIQAGIPLRIRLLSADGIVLDESFITADANGTKGITNIPLTATATVTLMATELITGKEVKQIIAVVPAKPAELSIAATDAVGPVANAIGASTSKTYNIPATAFGPHLKDIVILADGTTGVINAMNWDNNLYAVDLNAGAVKWKQRIGNHFAYGPQAVGGGFVVQGYDLNTAEGYHLYMMDNAGKAERRFALYGLPKRVVSWCIGKSLLDNINNFVTAPDGSWVASSGDLGLAVWNRDGKLLWSQDWWKTTRQKNYLLAIDGKTLLTMINAMATAYNAATGEKLWSLKLSEVGALQSGIVSADRKTIALRADSDGGRVFVIRDGKVINTFVAASDALALSPDGSTVVVTNGNSLKCYAADAGLVWNFAGDDTLRNPQISPDGKRIAVGSEMGSLYIFDVQGTLLHEEDFNSLPSAAWLSNGDLLVATWMGVVTRLDGGYNQKWRILAQPAETDIRSKLLAVDNTPTIKMTGWGNADAQPAGIEKNLLKDTSATITAMWDPGTNGPEWKNKIDMIRDGKPDAPPVPWITSSQVNMIDSGWVSKFSIVFDTFRAQIKLTGITFVEDKDHPESWMRDVQLQYWDTDKEQWIDGPYMLSNSAIHTHTFNKPIEAAKFRFISTGGASWPVGNIRLGELVFHGEVLGASHPDVVAKRPLAILFDEKEADMKSLNYPGRPFAFKYDDAYSGGKSMALTAAGNTGANYIPPFGHVIPNWDFEIVEKPEPGQYRYLQFAWKALSPQTTGMTFLIGHPWPGGGFVFTAGKYKWNEGVLVEKIITDTPPQKWTVVRVDLWDMYKKPIRLQSMSIGAVGGGAAFDQIVLGRTEADLPPIK